MSYPVWTPGAWIFDKNFPIAVDGVPIAQPNFTDSPTVTWTFDPLTMKVTANFANGSPASSTFVYTGTVDPTVTAGLLTGSLYLNTVSGALFQLQIVGSANTWVQIGSIIASVPVTSVFGRTGAVVPQFGDYSFSELTGSATANQIPPLSQITGAVTASQVPTLNQIPGSITASQVTGQLASNQLPSPLISPNIVSGNVNNIITVDGTTYTTLFQAMSALPASGGTIDMRGNSSAAALALSTGFASGIIDPGSASVTILLGPYAYTASQIVMRSNLQIFGAGAGQGLGATTKPPTIIQSIGSNSTPLFILGQTVNEGEEDVILKGFRCQGAIGNTSQTCFQIIPAQNGGLWYSEFNDLLIGGFAGISLNFESANNGTNQFSIFRRVVASRVSGGSYALRIKGYANCLRFENCQFDGGTFGVRGGDGLTNIIIQDDVGASFVPYDIQFDLLTTQWAGVGIQVNGCDNLEINQGHFEGCSGAVQIGDGAVNNSMGVILQNCWFGNGTGVNSGNGFIVNQTTANTQLSVMNNHIFGVPDTMFKGTVVNTPQYGLFESTNPIPLPPAFGSTTGFGNGSAGTSVTTTTHGGGGTGPASADVIVKYQQVQVNGSVYWIPLFQ